MAAGSSYMQTANAAERNQEATVFVGGLDEKVSDEILWELMIQAGPVKHVYIPRDRITRQAQGYGFCEFRTEEDAQYAVRILNMIKLYGKPIKVQPSSEHKRNMEVGANIFIGNLDPDVDEKTLHDTFSAFGLIIETPHIMRDPETGNSQGYGFVKFNSFEASDAAIEAMNGGFIMNRSIVVQYAFKKDGHNKERHGSQAERLLAAKGQDSLANSSNAGNYAPPGAGGSVQNQWQMPPSGPPPPRAGGYGYPGGYGTPEGGVQPPPPPPQGPSGAPPAMGIPAHAPPSGPMGQPPAVPPPLPAPADPSGQMHQTSAMRAPMPPPAQYSQQYNSTVQPPAAEMPPPPGAPTRPPPPPVPRQPIENMHPPPPRT
ncbi:hypothetical protein NDN08_005104 [Rhodosorus marinus]|uniref:Splicing factor 3B subunit 4 n=1 Tax=Rhodosorus marinus TaxID=101924 RepID=A0AAV8V1L3_9RHOD|nr:hypothetical protein NDN08_005104 [Rhodosorus marinus]